MTLTCPDGMGGTVVIASMSYGVEASMDQSLTRVPEADPLGIWVLHSVVPPGLFFSPGTCADGAPFAVCLP